MEEKINKGVSKKNTVIYVTVDTKKINENNVNQHVVFSDDRNDPPQVPGKPEDYISTINPGMKVYWRGLAKDPDSGDNVEITEVNVKKGQKNWKLLDKVEPEQGNKGARVGRIKGKYIDGQEPYYVKFRIEGQKSEFEVDPKLQMELRSHEE